MIRRPPRSTRTDTLFPYTTLFRSNISDQTRSSANAPYGSLGCDIWIYPVSGGKKKNLTEAKGSNWSPAWSPDGGKLAFHSDRDGVPGVWVWKSKADTVRKVSNLATNQSRGYEFLLWLDDKRKIGRAEERRVGKECVSKCRSRG